MAEKSFVLTRKKALFLVLLCAAVLIFLIALRWHKNAGIDLSTMEGREMFLSELGWQIDKSTEESKTVLIPDKLSGVIADYNEMQLQQGYDLNKHLGEYCQQFTYTVTNYSGFSGTVLVTIYVQGRNIIAGDIHAAAMDGFMHGIKKL